MSGDLLLVLPLVLGLGAFGWLGDLPFLLVTLVIGLGAMVPRLRPLSAIALLSSPWVAPAWIGAFDGFVAWADGSAADPNRGVRLPDGQADLEPGRYYQIASGGCLISLEQAVEYSRHDGAYNDFLAVWTSLFGPPRGAYSGEIPSPGTAVADLLRGSTLIDPRLDQGSLHLDDRVTPVTSGWLRGSRMADYGLAYGTDDWVAISGVFVPRVTVLDRTNGAPLYTFTAAPEDAVQLKRRWLALLHGD